MNNKEDLPVVKEQKKRSSRRSNKNATEVQSILLRMPANYSTALRSVADREKRTMTAVMTKAMQLYLKEEHGISIAD